MGRRWFRIHLDAVYFDIHGKMKRWSLNFILSPPSLLSTILLFHNFVLFYFSLNGCGWASPSLRAVDLGAHSALWQLYYTVKILFTARVDLSQPNEHFS